MFSDTSKNYSSSDFPTNSLILILHQIIVEYLQFPDFRIPIPPNLWVYYHDTPNKKRWALPSFLVIFIPTTWINVCIDDILYWWNFSKWFWHFVHNLTVSKGKETHEWATWFPFGEVSGCLRCLGNFGNFQFFYPLSLGGWWVLGFLRDFCFFQLFYGILPLWGDSHLWSGAKRKQDAPKMRNPIKN